MHACRIENGVERPEPVAITVDEKMVFAYPGESIASALLASGRQAFRVTRSGEPRAPFCNMGACFECVVEVDGVPGVRACMTCVRAGMRIVTGVGAHGSG